LTKVKNTQHLKHDKLDVLEEQMEDLTSEDSDFEILGGVNNGRRIKASKELIRGD
jgi:hypothetical protein